MTINKVEYKLVDNIQHDRCMCVECDVPAIDCITEGLRAKCKRHLNKHWSKQDVIKVNGKRYLRLFGSKDTFVCDKCYFWNETQFTPCPMYCGSAFDTSYLVHYGKGKV